MSILGTWPKHWPAPHAGGPVGLNPNDRPGRPGAHPGRFARYNRQLDRYYAKALAKEEARERLLKDALGLAEVRHMVVSRFPVATSNPWIIPYSRIGQFRCIAAPAS